MQKHGIGGLVSYLRGMAADDWWGGYVDVGWRSIGRRLYGIGEKKRESDEDRTAKRPLRGLESLPSGGLVGVWRSCWKI